MGNQPTRRSLRHAGRTRTQVGDWALRAIKLKTPHRCGIALGSNIGDRFAHLRAGQTALARLHTGPGAPLISRVYETDPVDCEPGTAPYLNAVAEIATDLEPLELLRALQEIEHAQGRPIEHGHNTPRTLDLDLLYAGDLTFKHPELTVPHPRLTIRRFVLQPLSDLRPTLILPGTHQTVTELLAALPPSPSVHSWGEFPR